MSLFVSLFEGRSRQERREPPGEVGALEDVLVRAGQAVGDGGACRLSLGDPLIQLGELALVQLPPTVAGRRTRRGERFDLPQRETDISQQQDHTDQPDRRWRITPLA